MGQAVTFPFVSQRGDADGSAGGPIYACGAAALAMVLRGFGRPASLAELDGRLPTARGSRRARTFHLASLALEEGLAAIILQTSNPRAALEPCHLLGMGCILNHRLTLASTAGHFSVLTAVGDAGVALHDPWHGPSRRLAWSEFLSLWRPHHARSEIAGQTYIALARRDATVTAARCSACGAAIPEATTCPRCQRKIELGIPGALGCVDRRCSQRHWRRLFCPHCDYPSFEIEVPPPSAIRPRRRWESVPGTDARGGAIGGVVPRETPPAA